MDASRRTRTTAALLAVTIAAGAALGSPAVAGKLAGVGVSISRADDVLGAHALRTLDGRTVSIADMKGEVLVVNFWASWCRPCRRELPALDALNGDLAKKGGRVLAVSIDTDLRNAARFARAHKLSLPVFHDGPDGLARKLDLTHIPMTLVIDRKGDVVYTMTGSDDAALAELRSRTLKLAARQPYADANPGDLP